MSENDHTTIYVSRERKAEIDAQKPDGVSYDWFLGQLVEAYNEVNGE